MTKKSVFISFSLGETSVSEYFLELAKQLAVSYNVVIFSDKQLPIDLEIPSYIVIKYWSSVRPTKFRDFKFLLKEIKFYKPFLTISNFGSVNIFLIAGFLGGVKYRLAWIHTLTTQFVQKKHLLIRKSIVYKLSTNIIANSEATKEDAVINYKISKSKIKVFPNAVKDSYSKVKMLEDFYINKIVYVGRLHKSKGVDILVDAMSLVNQEFSNFTLDIIGSGPERENLISKIELLKLVNNIFLKGSYSKKSVLEAFKSSYLAVIPSLSEAFGYTVVEAMSMKTLVIGANNTGIKEIIIDNKTGLLFETADVYDLAKKIKTVLADREFRDRLALSGYDHFCENYECKRIIEKICIYLMNLK